MSLAYTLPAGKYFLGDAGHLYHTATTKPPALDPSVPENEEFINWFVNDIAFEHYNSKYNAIGMCTGARNQVRLTTTYSSTMARTQAHAKPSETCVLPAPHFTFYVLPVSLFPVEWLEAQKLEPVEAFSDPQVDYTDFGHIVEFASPVRVLLCAQDWVHSNGFVSLESRHQVVLMEYGFPQAPVFMPRADVAKVELLSSSWETGDYDHISLQDLHSLVVALVAHCHPSDDNRLPSLHQRLNNHLQLFSRGVCIEGASTRDNVLHAVMLELNARYIQADAQLRDFAFLATRPTGKKRRLLDE